MDSPSLSMQKESVGKVKDAVIIILEIINHLKTCQNWESEGREGTEWQLKMERKWIGGFNLQQFFFHLIWHEIRCIFCCCYIPFHPIILLPGFSESRLKSKITLLLQEKLCNQDLLKALRFQWPFSVKHIFSKSLKNSLEEYINKLCRSIQVLLEIF